MGLQQKRRLAYSEIHAPEDAPEWVYDRQTLWQRIEDVETKSNARLASEYTIALPKEFTAEQNIEFLKEFAANTFVSRGIVVDVNFHNDNPKNPHAHLMYVLRQLEKFPDGTIDFSTHRCRELQSRAFLEWVIKEEHKHLLNKHLALNGYEMRLEWGAVNGQEATIHHGGVK
jgi:ATP-dependent exoDNAse (exonuclease V) alpha subunit